VQNRPFFLYWLFFVGQEFTTNSIYIHLCNLQFQKKKLPITEEPFLVLDSVPNGNARDCLKAALSLSASNIKQGNIT